MKIKIFIACLLLLSLVRCAHKDAIKQNRATISRKNALTRETGTTGNKRTHQQKSFNNVQEITADSSFSTWIEREGSNFSLAMHFMYKDTLAFSYSPECWLLYPYKIDGNRIVVYWDTIIDAKYAFDLVNAINKIDETYLGKPFMVLELQSETTISAKYPFPELIRLLNNSSHERVFFPTRYSLVKDGFIC